MQKMALRALAMALALAVPGGASAATSTVQLPGVVGNYEVPGDKHTDTFDFGVSFSEIESVLVSFTAGDARSLHDCPNIQLDNCVFTSFGLYLFPSGGGPRRVGTLVSPRANSTASWELIPVDELGHVTDQWPAFLFDGVGIATLELFEVGVLNHPYRGEVLGAELSIIGTPVPEPSALLLAAGAVAVVLRWARSKAVPQSGLWLRRAAASPSSESVSSAPELGSGMVRRVTSSTQPE